MDGNVAALSPPQCTGNCWLPAVAERADRRVLVDHPAEAFDLNRAARSTGGRVVAAADCAGFVPPAGGGATSRTATRLRPWAWAAALLLYLLELTYRRMPGRRVA